MGRFAENLAVKYQNQRHADGDGCVGQVKDGAEKHKTLIGAEKEIVRTRANRLNGLLDAVLSEDRKIS